MRRNDRSSNGRQKRTRGQRPRTISVSLSDRGQTTQDFAIGIGVFLLSVAFVFSYLPSLTTPFDSSVGGAEAAQADRIADRVLSDVSSPERPNEIAKGEFRVLSDVSSPERPNEIAKGEFDEYHDKEDHELIKSLGIRGHSDDKIAFDKVDIRVEGYEGETVDERTVETEEYGKLATGAEYDGQSAASAARIVTLDDEFTLENHEDEAAYRLVVRVW